MRRRLHWCLWGVLGLLLATAPVRAVVWNVDGASPVADDANPGTEARPIKTISAAAVRARAGDTVLIQPAVYRETVSLAVSGTPEHPIVFQAAKPGVAIDGADRLRDWMHAAETRPIYTLPWSHDFIIDTDHDGNPVRFHGAPAPVGCAEQIFCNGQPLRQVMSEEELAEGCFFVDWEIHRLSVWLPGGADPDDSDVQGSVRDRLFTPAVRDDRWAQSDFITVRGLTFRHAANFAQRSAVRTSNGWQVEDCLSEWNNGGGIDVAGQGVSLLGVTSQFNGFCGIAGEGKDILIQGCVSRGNNRKGFSPGWEGGGGKFSHTVGLHIVNHRAFDNVGPGIWLDDDNRDYLIRDCIVFNNRGLKADWQGGGIFLEISQGPGEVQSNIVFGNTGAGITVAESRDVRIEGNTLVDNGEGIELRAMDDRAPYRLGQVIIRNNRFKNWRQHAICTSLGQWDPKSTAADQIQIDSDVFDPPPDHPFFGWADHDLDSLDQVRRLLHYESSGKLGSIIFSPP